MTFFLIMNRPYYHRIFTKSTQDAQVGVRPFKLLYTIPRVQIASVQQEKIRCPHIILPSLFHKDISLDLKR